MPLSSTTGSVSYLVVAASSSAPVSVTHPACLLVQQVWLYHLLHVYRHFLPWQILHSVFLPWFHMTLGPWWVGPVATSSTTSLSHTWPALSARFCYQSRLFTDPLQTGCQDYRGPLIELADLLLDNLKTNENKSQTCSDTLGLEKAFGRDFPYPNVGGGFHNLLACFVCDSPI